MFVLRYGVGGLIENKNNNHMYKELEKFRTNKKIDAIGVLPDKQEINSLKK